MQKIASIRLFFFYFYCLIIIINYFHAIYEKRDRIKNVAEIKKIQITEIKKETKLKGTLRVV